MLLALSLAAQDSYLQHRRSAFRTTAAAAAFDPTNVAGLYAQWVADDINLADGAAVSNWTDRIFGCTVSMLTNEGRMPHYTNNLWNGHDGLRFDGGDNLFKEDSAFTAHWQGQDMAFSIFVVCSKDVTNTAMDSIALFTNNVMISLRHTSGTFSGVDVGSNLYGSSTNDYNRHVYVYIDHGVKTSLWLDRYLDKDEAAANRGALNPNIVCIGASLSASPAWQYRHIGFISEVLIYTNAVTKPDVTNIIDFLITKYDITPF